MTMLYPSIDQLVKKVDSKYSLVVATARRARQLRDGLPSKLDHVKSSKNVGIALEEIFADEVQYDKVSTD